MLMGDVAGALTSAVWYEVTYPDNGGELYQYLTWALALFRGGRRQEAFNKLYQTMLENFYLLIFGTDATSHEFSMLLRCRESY